MVKEGYSQRMAARTAARILTLRFGVVLRKVVVIVLKKVGG